MKLILTRHGETIENSLGILQGRILGQLSEEGLKQADKLALRLKDEKIDAIFSSDLARASDTAKEIAKFHPNARIEFVEDLREFDMGDFTGKKVKEVDWHKKPDNMETLAQGQTRIRKFLDKTYDEYNDKIVLFVSHGGIGKALINSIKGDPPEKQRELQDQSNTSVNIFEIKEDGKHNVVLFNCVKHLE